MIEVKITKYSEGVLAAKIGSAFLFLFDYCKDSNRWKFYSTGGGMKKKEGHQKFPLEFFKQLCRSVAFIKYGDPLESEVRIVSGKSYIR